MFYSLSAGYYRSNMYVRRRSLGQQGFICIFHRSTRSKHRIGKNQCFSIQFWRSDVFDMNVEMIFIDVFAVSRYESILGMVEIIDESSVERKPCTQNGRNNRTDSRYVFHCFGKRRAYHLLFIRQVTADFVCHDFPDTFDIPPESQTVLLDVDIAHLGKELV